LGEIERQFSKSHELIGWLRGPRRLQKEGGGKKGKAGGWVNKKTRNANRGKWSRNSIVRTKGEKGKKRFERTGLHTKKGSKLASEIEFG